MSEWKAFRRNPDGGEPIPIPPPTEAQQRSREEKPSNPVMLATKEDRADQPKLSKSQWIAQSVKMLAGSVLERDQRGKPE
jgi:hypothetical protein